ncbi:hypothetical protein J1614_009891 [Plenodomus biglobosus]|nr:hypothetical protein J1614_009891 [Plenodomus biglobosus]
MGTCGSWDQDWAGTAASLGSNSVIALALMFGTFVSVTFLAQAVSSQYSSKYHNYALLSLETSQSALPLNRDHGEGQRCPPPCTSKLPYPTHSGANSLSAVMVDDEGV